MAIVIEFPSPRRAGKTAAIADKAPSKGAKAALERAINKSLENERRVVTLEEEIMIFLFLEGYRIVPHNEGEKDG